MPTDERYIHLRRTCVPLELGSFGLIQTTLSNRKCQNFPKILKFLENPENSLELRPMSPNTKILRKITPRGPISTQVPSECHGRPKLRGQKYVVPSDPENATTVLRFPENAQKVHPLLHDAAFYNQKVTISTACRL